MKITFVLPPLNLAGGQRVAAIYAAKLRERGHDVFVIAPPRSQTSKQRAKQLLARALGRATGGDLQPSHVGNFGLPHLVLDRSRPVTDSDLPPADVVIATWWETAEWVGALAPEKGAKVYFIQGYEVFPWLPQDRSRATYRQPMRKIVVAQWLADVMAAEYGDEDVRVVPNSVDHAQFFAPRRTKQARPTVGFIYARGALKGIDLVLESLKRLRAWFPGLRAVAFGSERPDADLPSWIEFRFNPPQSEIRHLYSACDVWLTASWSEGFNLPAMEAMSCRTPVVSTRTGWPVEAFVDGVNGALVALGDAAGLATSARAILQLPEEQWLAMSDAAYATVRDSSWERSTDKFEAELFAAVNANHASRGRRSDPVRLTLGGQP